ncbi:MAG: hypothetical protein V2I51_19455 [Anderseniella sp.]|jgi:hypothetical protein|nr:hypothetical protein [Anderseniella sp.]
MLVQFIRLIYLLAAGLSMAAAALVTASMVIAERAPQTTWFWGVTIFISLFFAGLALLLLGIAWHLPAIGQIAHCNTHEALAPAFRRHWEWLAVIMAIAGLLLCLFLLLGVYVIIARIDQGFAVFG